MGKENSSSNSDDKYIAIDALQENLGLLEISVEKKDQNGLKRVLRKTTGIRKNLCLDDFRVVMENWISKDSPSLKQINGDLDKLAKKVMEDDSKLASEAKRQEHLKKEKCDFVLPEVEAYLNLFVVQKLIEQRMYQEGLDSVTFLLSQANNHNRRTLDLLQARAYHFKARCLELLGSLKELRGELLAAHRTACLRMDEYGQATLINLLLRNYSESNLVEQAIKFASKATFPDSISNNQQVRYLYYMGRIHAIQLDYSVAYKNLTQAIRKAPTHTGLGFRVSVYKLASIVQLLMGDTPERSWFSQKELEIPLLPYFELVKAVRNGSLLEYDSVQKKYATTFAKDRLASLVARLRNSVIRTGLRRINLSYSKISFKDIAKKLALDSPESAELTCAKAIRDGVIDATLDHQSQHLKSSDAQDIYSTIEPQQAFHKRIQFCLAVHNEAVKAMRYPPDAHKVKQDVSEEEKDQKTDEELAKEIEAELDEDED